SKRLVLSNVNVYYVHTTHDGAYLVLLPSRPDTIHKSTIVVRPFGTYYYSADHEKKPVFSRFICKITCDNRASRLLNDFISLFLPPSFLLCILYSIFLRSGLFLFY